MKFGKLNKVFQSKKDLANNDRAWSLWEPRPHQKNAWSKIIDNKRNVLIWHRRAGKDLLAVNYILHHALQKKGLYWHVYPTYSQGKKALWDAMDSQGNKFLDAIGGEKNISEMSVRLVNGSKYQVIGADSDPSSIRGANPIGVVFSEYSYMKPEIWDVVRPILSENGGWALFLYTPCGQNHGYDLYKMALKIPEWHVEKLGVKDTKIIDEKELQQLKEEGVLKELIDQEYHCEFINYVYGSYFSSIIAERESLGYIAEINIDTITPVTTYWDIGHNTAIWFVQKQGEFWHVIDFFESTGQPVEYCLSEIKSKPYKYTKHVFPHDMNNKEYSTGITRFNAAKTIAVQLELRGEFSIQRKFNLKEGIELTRRFLSTCKINKNICQKGINHLSNYKRAMCAKSGVYLDFPENNQQSSHATDAFRYIALDYSNEVLHNSFSFTTMNKTKTYNYMEY